MRKRILIISWAGFTIAGLLACSASPQLESSQNARASQNVRVAPTPSVSDTSSVRAIDFANFVYPAERVFSTGIKSLALKNGRYDGNKTHDPVILASVAYGDVTSDGTDEALVILEISVRGTAIPHVAYVYTRESEAVKLLWAFQTGDRGDGGLRQIYPEGGRLVVELYGKDKLIGKNLYESDPYAAEGVCCPKFFTRARYSWQAGHFYQEGKEEVLPNPEGDAPLVMTPYKP
jgi:hypothetical protein